MSSPHDRSSADPAALSMALHQQTAIDLLGLQKFYRYLIMVFVPLCVAVIIMSTFWADILAKKDKYTDLNNQWQACLTSADYQYIGLQAQLSKATTALQSCIIGLVMSGTCSIDCALGIKGTCVSTPPSDIALPSGHMLSGLSYLGVQTVIFAAIAHAGMRRALFHPSWLMSTIALVFWFLFAIFTYYMVSPILPVPAQTNSTILVYMYYFTDMSRFNNLSTDSDSNCQKAFDYAWVYLAIIAAIAFTVFIGGIVGIYAERIRYKSPSRKVYEPLAHTEIPLIIGFLAIIFYIILAVCKLGSSLTSLDAIFNLDNDTTRPLYSMQNYFPFAQPNLDISTILGIASFMSVLRGYTIQSISAFRMACVTALVFTISTYPAIIGGFEFYYHNDFNNFNTCKNYFLASGQTAAFGYPSEFQAKLYCIFFRMGLAASTGLFATLHFLTVACYFMFTQNSERESMVHPPLDFEAAALEREARASRSQKSNFNDVNPLVAPLYT